MLTNTPQLPELPRGGAGFKLHSANDRSAKSFTLPSLTPFLYALPQLLMLENIHMKFFNIFYFNLSLFLVNVILLHGFKSYIYISKSCIYIFSHMPQPLYSTLSLEVFLVPCLTYSNKNL